MTKVHIMPGPCGNITTVEAQAGPRKGRARMVNVKIESKCAAITGMAEALGTEFNAMELCLKRPGLGPFFEYAQQHFPVHVGCPAINGIIKCIEAEAGLALKKNASIEFIDDEPAGSAE